MTTCPTCHRPFIAKRTCALCLLPIKRIHHWHIEGFYVVHDSCSDPALAMPAQPLLEEVLQ